MMLRESFKYETFLEDYENLNLYYTFPNLSLIGRNIENANISLELNIYLFDNNYCAAL